MVSQTTSTHISTHRSTPIKPNSCESFILYNKYRYNTIIDTALAFQTITSEYIICLKDANYSVPRDWRLNKLEMTLTNCLPTVNIFTTPHHHIVITPPCLH